MVYGKGGHIIFLQETFSTQDIVSNWSSSWDGFCIYSHGTNHSKGVMILINKGLDITLKHTIIDTGGRYIFTIGSLQNQEVILGNVYFPVSSKEQEQLEFLDSIFKILERKEFQNKPFIIGGDFNMVRDIHLDYEGRNINKKQSKLSSMFENFLIDYSALDIWRFKNVSKKQYTYHQGNPYMQSRLDYWVVSDILEEKVLDCKIIPSLTPDHSAIELNINFTHMAKPMMKTGYWKFNNSLCKDEEYVKSMKEEIIRLKQILFKEITNSRILWDYVKMEIRSFTRKYSKKKAKTRKNKIAKIEQEIVKLEEELQQSPSNRNKDLIDVLTRKSAVCQIQW